jgi:U3 small nucleolar RNA-associated protein 12
MDTSSGSNGNSTTIQHTYLRYECRDTFGLAISTGTTSRVPITDQILVVVGPPLWTNTTLQVQKAQTQTQQLCYTVAGSVVQVWDLYKSYQPIYKIGHGGSNHSTNSLNDNEIVCIDIVVVVVVMIAPAKVRHSIAIGYIDGTIRLYELDPYEMIPSLQRQSASLSSSTTSWQNDSTTTSPLVLQGHTSPITCLSFDRTSNTNTTNTTTSTTTPSRLVSGSSDGCIILWDVLNECGLFRFLGHRGAISQVQFCNLTTTTRTKREEGEEDHRRIQNTTSTPPTPSTPTTTTTTTTYLISACSGDQLIKVWDMEQQCCIQTITHYRSSTKMTKDRLSFVLLEGKYDTTTTRSDGIQQQQRQPTRLMTTTSGGGNSNNSILWNMGQVVVATTTTIQKKNTIVPDNSVAASSIRTTTTTANTIINTTDRMMDTTDTDAVCHYVGGLKLPTVVPNGISNSSSGSSCCIQYTSDRRYMGLLRGNDHCIDIYRILSTVECSKKRNRRLKRRQEKLNKKKQGSGHEKEEDNDEDPMVQHSNRKRRGILDDDDDDDDESDQDHPDNTGNDNAVHNDPFDPELLQVTDQFEFVTRINVWNHSVHKTKIRSFRFVPIPPPSTRARSQQQHKPVVEFCRILCANINNTMEIYSVSQQQQQQKGGVNSTDAAAADVIIVEPIQVLDYYGHTTGIRSVALSSTDHACCTVSKTNVKIWNVSSRSCIASIPLSIPKSMKSSKTSLYGLCVIFLPGDTHVVVGTREGIILLLDIHANEIIYVVSEAHSGPVWSLDIKKPSNTTTTSASTSSSTVVIMSGSADKQVKFWNVESSSSTTNDENDTVGPGHHPILRHTRTLQMTDDVIAVKYSHSTDPTRRMVFVTTLDSTIKVFFDDTLKMFLSLYGHKLPALTMDCSDDDTILASGGADKTIKIWGLDFGDTHRTLHGHTDSITDLRFVRRTHYFFTCSKDYSVRYWDGDRFEQILLLNGHSAEVNCLAISRTGAFVLSAGMDRQVRVWDRTKDIVFLEEERERELEQLFDRVNNRDEGGTGRILDRNQQRSGNQDNDDDEDGIVNDSNENEPQSEAAVRKSVTSVASGDRIMEALERADQELKDMATFRKAHGPDKKRSPNLLMLSLEPAPYVLWVLRTIKSAEIEQSLILLSLRHIERLMYYLILLLKSGQGIELCSRVAVFLVKAHQNQVRLDLGGVNFATSYLFVR